VIKLWKFEVKNAASDTLKKKMNYIKGPVYFCSSSSLKDSRLLGWRQLEFL